MANGRSSSKPGGGNQSAVRTTKRLGQAITRTAQRAANSSRGSGPSRGSRSSDRSMSRSPSRNTRSNSLRPGRNRNR